MNPGILEALAGESLPSLAPAFKILAKSCYQARLGNNGRVPKEIFEACVGIGGVCPCYQVIVKVVDEAGKLVGYALRKREAAEVGDAWKGMYHNVCTVARMMETPDDIRRRIFSDITGNTEDDSDVEYLGITIHHEKERRCDAHTTIFRVVMGS